MHRQAKYSGFTLIEILVVVGLIAILAAITIVAINPAKNFQSTRNTQRSSDISAILNAVTQYTSESGNTIDGLITAAGYTGNGGVLESCVGQPSTAGAQIVNNSNGGLSAGSGTDEEIYIDLESQLVSEFLVAIPEDPNQSSTSPSGGTLTGYFMCKSTDGRVQIFAPYTEPLDGSEPIAKTTDLYVVR